MSERSPGGAWCLSHRFDKRALPLADRHYNRRKVGSPQFVPPGRCLVLLTAAADAVWVTSWPIAKYVRHAWAGAWVNSLFRNESGARGKGLIREAVALTLGHFGAAPPLGMVTFVDADKVRSKSNPGHVYLMAGFRPARCPTHWPAKMPDCAACESRTEGGLIAWQMRPEKMPQPRKLTSKQLSLSEAA